MSSDRSDLSKLTVSELKQRLKDKNLTVGGKKSELIERLENSEEKSENDSDSNNQPSKKSAYASESSSDEQETMASAASVSTSTSTVSPKSDKTKRKRKLADMRREDSELESKEELSTDTHSPPTKRHKKAVADDTSEFKIVCFNINGIRASAKKGLEKVIAKENADIVCFSEMKAKQSQNPCDFGDDYQLIWNECTAKAGYAGSGILTKREPLSITRGIGMDDTEGRALTLEYDSFFLVNTYVPNSGQNLKFEDRRRTWDTQMLEYLQSLQEKKPVIWTGDLNVAIQDFDVYDGETNKQRCKSPGFTTYERENFRTLLKTLKMVDSYRHFYPNVKADAFTFYTPRGNDMKKNGKGWRLDYFVVSKPVMELINDVQIRKKVECSDHVPLVLTMKDPHSNL